MIFRGSVLMIGASTDAIYNRINVFKFPKQTYVAVVIRFLTGLVGIPCFFHAIKYIPMSQGSIILAVNPLISVILAYFFLSEVLHFRNIVLLIGAFLGVFITNLAKSENEHITTYEDKYFLGVILTLIALVFRSSAPVSIRQINLYLPSIFSPFYFSLGMFLNSVFTLLFLRDYLNFEYYDTRTVILF
mmetsp:Transcript_8551/g.9698  ORF Transcript_8551/g.9698 Transcript_8551/m.9698 type:complete len:188 (-) Transcript_8551:246-809(-)